MKGKLFLSWNRPTQQQQQACTASAEGFNYNSTLQNASALSTDEKNLQNITKNGFFINRARVLLGHGPITYAIAKSAVLAWKHFGLKWAFVDPQTSVEKGRRFCVCVKELIPWVMMPLQIAYVAETSVQPRAKAFFGFGSGTLQGHLLVGEERFSVEWDEEDRVWYEIFSFSKPSHVLAAVGYPYVRFRQKCFARQSAEVMLKYVSAQKLEIEVKNGV